MRRRTVLLIAGSLGPLLLTAQAAMPADAAGRWQGLVDFKGLPQPIVLDLARSGEGTWIGSITLPGRRVKGAPMTALAVDARGLRADVAAAFLAPGTPAPRLALRWRDARRANGELTAGGIAAPVMLERSGEAQVDLPLANTPIDDALAGTWTGRYELGGTPRDVTLTLRRGASGIGEGQLLIVGRRRTELVLDRVRATGLQVELAASPAYVAIEGRRAGATIEGLFMQGPFEAPLLLRKSEDAR